MANSVPNARAFIAELQGRTTRDPNNPFFKNKDQPLSSAYIQSFARALRAFSSWLYEDGYVDTNVLRPLKPPKVQQKIVEALSDAGNPASSRGLRPELPLRRPQLRHRLHDARRRPACH